MLSQMYRTIVAVLFAIVALPFTFVADLFNIALYPADWMPTRKGNALRNIVAMAALMVVLSACGSKPQCPDGSHYADSTNPSYKATGMCLSNTDNSFVAVPYNWLEEGRKPTAPIGNGDPIAKKAADTVNQYGSNPVDNVSHGLTSAQQSAPAVNEGAQIGCSKLDHSDSRWINGQCARGQ